MPPACARALPPVVPVLVLACAMATSAGAEPDQPVADVFAALPLSFVPNTGQADAHVRYHARARGLDAFFLEDAVLLRSAPGECGPGAVVRVEMVGARRGLVVEPFDPLPGVVSFYIGDDPARWRTELPTSAGLAYREVWPGIDVTFAGTDRRLKREIVVAPGADVSRVRFRYAGPDALRVREDGALVVETAQGTLVEDAPIAWEEIAGARRDVSVRFRVEGLDAAFDAPARTPGATLVIDPVMDFATFFGGSAEDELLGGRSNARLTPMTIAGRARSLDLPLRDPGWPSAAGGWDGFAANVDLQLGAVTRATYFGGAGDDEIVDAFTDSFGRFVQFLLNTNSADLPRGSSFRGPDHSGGIDVFVVNMAGSDVLVTTYLGGSGDDELRGWTPGLTLAGVTSSPDFLLEIEGRPVPPRFSPWDGRLDGPSDGFVGTYRHDASSSTPLWKATYVGGSGEDRVDAVRTETGGSILAWGTTASPDFALPGGALDATLSGASDAFLIRLGSFPGGADPIERVTEGTLVGGSGAEAAASFTNIASDDIAVAGETTSDDFPVANALQPARAGGADAFVAVVDGDLATIEQATYFGGAGDERLAEQDGLHDSVATTLIGTTPSSDLPGAALNAHSGGRDVFVARLNLLTVPPRVEWVRYLGGGGDDVASAGYVTRTCVAVVGLTTSPDFPVHRAVQPRHAGGGTDGFLARICEHDELGAIEPELAIPELSLKVDLIESKLDAPGPEEALEAKLDALEVKADDAAVGQSSVIDATAALEAKADAAEAKLDALGAAVSDLQARVEALAAASDDELARDVETALERKECSPWLWLDEPAGHWIFARAHVEARIGQAEASGDVRSQIRLARERLAESDADRAARDFQKACQRLSEALRFLTSP